MISRKRVRFCGSSMAPASKRFSKSLNCCEGGSQFVRHVGHKIAAHTLELAQFADVVQHHDGAGRLSGANGGNRDGEIVLPQRASDNFRLHARLATQDFAHGFDQFRLPHHFHQCASGGRRHIQPENFRKSRIRKHQPLRTVHYRDAFDHASQNRGGQVALFRQRADGAFQASGRAVERNAERFQGVAGTVAGQWAGSRHPRRAGKIP